MSTCQCSMAISMLGDGCRYCQPQTYIEHLLETLEDARAAPVSEAKAQGVVMPEGWIPLTIEHELGYPEDVAFGPKRMMDRLKKWLDRYFEMRLNAAPSPADHVEDVRAMVDAPSPAGVDGLEVVGYVSQDDIKWRGDCTLRLNHYSDYVVPLCRLSSAQASIDGLRGEVAKINSDRLACWAEFKVMTRACLDAEKERDQQAQRIGELEGLLRDERAYGPLGVSCQNGVVARCVCRMCRLRHIDAALSAGKEKQDEHS